MNLSATEQFWKLYRALPLVTRAQARVAYSLFAVNPQHPSLQFLSVHPSNLGVIRVGAHYRVFGILDSDAVIWFWIGTHEANNTIGTHEANNTLISSI